MEFEKQQHLSAASHRERMLVSEKTRKTSTHKACSTERRPALTQSDHGSESVRGHDRTMREMSHEGDHREYRAVTPVEVRQESREAQLVQLGLS